MATSLNFIDIAGPHPAPPHVIGTRFDHIDGHSTHGIPSRILTEAGTDPNHFIELMKDHLRKHHARPEDLQRDRLRREALVRQGFSALLSRFPANPNTQKGNWAEILLAEYIYESCGADLPVYRLRYNPNIEQSMKGDDVLAFDLDSDPVRVIVGEAKFREKPTKRAVLDIVAALEKSQRSGIPISLQFIADRLFSEGNEELGKRIEACSDLFIKGKIRLDRIGLLASNLETHIHVNRHAESLQHRIAIISVCLADGVSLIESCFDSLEEKS